MLRVSFATMITIFTRRLQNHCGTSLRLERSFNAMLKKVLSTQAFVSSFEKIYSGEETC